MFKRQTTGSVVCASCGYLVGVKDERCYHCGRRNPGLWGFAPALRSLGQDLGFVPLVTGISTVAYVASLVLSVGNISTNIGLNFLGVNTCTLLQFGASGSLPVFGLHRWWTVLSAAWLHANLLHIFFNMVVPVGGVYDDQVMKIIRKTEKGVITRETLPVRFVPMVRGSGS